MDGRITRIPASYQRRGAQGGQTKRSMRRGRGTFVMKTVVGRVVCLLASAGMMLTAAAGTAWAQPPITGTDVSTFSESFSEPFFCGGELYAVTANGIAVVHFTFFEETGALRFQEVVHGMAVSVPVDGTGPTYTANFWNSDLESIRAVRQGDVLVETDTDHFRAIAHGSDGSMALVTFHAHFTVNANGEMTVEFVTDRLVCT
jgi:hypothetical protein